MRLTVKLIMAIILLSTMAIAVNATSPDAASILTNGTPETKPAQSSSNVTADGGNITEVNITAEVQTANWQGFYGQVSGNFTLRDALFNQLYSWEIASPTGEVLVTSTSSVDFSTFSVIEICTIDESITGTGTDRVNNTFNNTTISLEIASTTFTQGCVAHTYTSNTTQSSVFPEFIGNATGATSIYVTAINSTTGYDGQTQDYQMIVPANSTPIPYAFYVEFD